MALFFSWFASNSLSRDPSVYEDPYAETKPSLPLIHKMLSTENDRMFGGVDIGVAGANDSRLSQKSDLFTVLLVTCYSEGESSIRTTLDSLSATSYDDRKKLLFVISDGIVKVLTNN